MADLLFDTALAQIQDALEQEISFALKRRRVPAATPAVLRSVQTVSGGTPAVRDLDLVFVVSLGRLFYWRQSSVAADDGVTVIVPADAGATGRWLRAESDQRFEGVPVTQIQEGILANVILHEGDFSDVVLNSRIFSKAPCVAIHFDKEKYKALSQVRGALYDYRVGFEIWSVSRNYRDRNEANTGPKLAAELAVDPGVVRIHGKVKKFLDGSNLGLGGTSDTDYSGIDNTEILGGSLERSDIAERLFVMALEIEVRGSLANPDAVAERTAVSRIDAQRFVAAAPAGGHLELANCVTAGLSVPLGTGFAKTIAAGTAVIGGVAVAVVAAAKTFTASTSTYRDLTPGGAWVFTEVAAGYDVPGAAAGNLRVGLTVTDAAGVGADSFLCSVYVPSESPDQIDL